MPAIFRNGRNYSGSDITKEDIVKMGFYELPEGGIPAEDIAEGVIPTIPESLPASDVPSWAKQPTKPSYTASEVGALSADGKAADSDKLDGHDSDHFATTTSVTTLSEDVNRHAFGEQSGGKNLIDYQRIYGGSKFTNTNGVISATATSFAETRFYVSSEAIGKEITISAKVKKTDGTNRIFIFVQFANGSYVQSNNATTNEWTVIRVTFIPTSVDDWIIVSYGSGGGYSVEMEYLQMEYGSNYTSYEPYIASNAQLTELADESEVRDAELRTLGWCVPDGMSLKNFVDSEGKLHQRIGRWDLSNRSFILDSSRFRAIGPTDIKKGVISVASKVYVYGYVTVPKANVGAVDKSVGIDNNGLIWMKNSSYETSEQFGNSLIGQYIYYELATEVVHDTYNLPSQKSMISDEWDSTRTYAVGEFCIYQNTLYECLVQNSGQNPSTASAYWRKTSVSEKLGTSTITINPIGSVSLDSNRSINRYGICVIDALVDCTGKTFQKGWNEIANVATNRPTSQANAITIVKDVPKQVRITTTGSVQIYTLEATTMGVGDSFLPINCIYVI